MRVGLVLGAGGVVGASWLIGALEALQDETGWDPSEADAIVGTSAGAVVGALTASGMPPAYMAAYVAGREVDEIAAAAARAGEGRERIDEALAMARSAEKNGGRPDGSGYRLARALPPIGPGSWRLALRTLVQPQRHSPAAMLCGWLPRGFVRTDPISELVEAFVPGDWPDHDAYWAVAADYSSGKRVAFGRDGAPPARVSQAVAASCAIPAFYHPVKVDGRRYVDGGICSPSNLDLLCDAELDLVVCLNPMSSLAQVSGGSPGDRVGALFRAMAGRRLGHEARKLRDTGTKVLMLQPGADDVKVMGFNMMSGSRRVAVTETAVKSTALALRRLRVRDDSVLPRRTRRTTAAPRGRRAAAAAKRKRRAA
jgi:NTE family protein